MSNGPISVSAPGKSLVGAIGTDVTFNTRYPFAKLDSTNIVSFQAISIFFGVDTPSPDGTTVTVHRTHLYSFPHGYKYVPTVWMMFQRIAGVGVQNDVTSTRISPYGYSGGTICVTTAADNAGSATLNISVDTTNVYIDVVKNAGFFAVPANVNLSGYTLLVRPYVFVEGTAGGEVPSQA